jgi:Cell Wall Hydrolase
VTGTLAQTIQGEAGSNPANQFAVASTIYNRMQAGNFPGGSDPNAIVNAPQQFVGFSATPNSSAQAMADAIQNGTLSSMGSTGNAVNFQSGQTAANNGFTNGGTNIGGNWFSDRFGAPTSNFQAPQYGGAGSAIATGNPDTSSGANPGTTDPLGSSVTQNPSGTSSTTTAGSNAGTGTPETQGLQTGTINAITGWITGIESAVGGVASGAIKSAETAAGTWLGSMQNWFSRAGLILLGVILIALALAVIMWDRGGKETIVNMGKAAAA